MPADKSPIEQALELLVYAPLGLALTARDELPSLIDRGRQQVASQTTLARMMGQFAVKEAEKQLRQRLDRLAERGPEAAAPRDPAGDGDGASAAGPSGGGSDATPATEGAPGRQPKAASDPGTANGQARRLEAPDLAIPGYDSLSASQVVQRLSGLSGPELAEVRAYEDATRGRRTILTKIAQLEAELT